jgi:amidase
VHPDTQGDEMSWWSANRVAAAIAAGRISAREYLTDRLARVARYDGTNLVVTIDERAMDEAHRADEAVRRGDPLGPLHGVSMTVKDSLATGGLRTTGGMSLLARHVPQEDAAAVAGLRRAGAIIFGKTNVAERSSDLQTFNELFGLSRNPWHPHRSPGGSSGGGAAAVAAGLTAVELGSDVAGSIRIPASNCGVFGHKPSRGIVPMHGHVPPAPFRLLEPDLSVVGPFARSVDDLQTVLEAVVAPHPWDRPGWHISLPPARPVRRVATWFDDPYCPVDDEIGAALEYASARLRDSGVRVEPARPAGIRLDMSDQLFRKLLATVALSQFGRNDIEAVQGGSQEPGPGLGAEHVAASLWDFMDATNRRERLRQRWRQFFTEYDAILLPVSPSLAIAHDLRPLAQRRIVVNGVERPYWDQTVWAGLTGVCYLPSTVAPVRLDSHGVPIGIAVASDYLQDLTAMAVARRLAEVVPPLPRPDITIWDRS